MPQRDSYAQGTPCWIDLQTTDPGAAKAFYAALFGWSYDDLDTPMGAVYSMATIDSDTVAAIGPQPPMAADNGVPPSWNTYLAVDDADAAVAAAAANGGTVLMAADDVMQAGRMAFVADPTGAVVGLWQAGDRIGATLVNEPNTLIWNELVTADNATALPFYRAVAGIESADSTMGDWEYTLLKANGVDVGGATGPTMDGVPNHWHTWFSVADAGATVAAAKAAGGSVISDVSDMPIGKVATIRDPQGAVFSILQSAG